MLHLLTNVIKLLIVKEKIGFKYSALNINEGLGDIDKWDENAIKARAEQLAKIATKVWGSPALKSSVLDAYRPTITDAGVQYSIDDHPYLNSGALRTLFDALRKAVLELIHAFTKNISNSILPTKQRPTLSMLFLRLNACACR